MSAIQWSNIANLPTTEISLIAALVALSLLWLGKMIESEYSEAFDRTDYYVLSLRFLIFYVVAPLAIIHGLLLFYANFDTYSRTVRGAYVSQIASLFLAGILYHSQKIRKDPSKYNEEFRGGKKILYNIFESTKIFYSIVAAYSIWGTAILYSKGFLLLSVSSTIFSVGILSLLAKTYGIKKSDSTETEVYLKDRGEPISGILWRKGNMIEIKNKKDERKYLINQSEVTRMEQNMKVQKDPEKRWEELKSKSKTYVKEKFDNFVEELCDLLTQFKKNKLAEKIQRLRKTG